MSRTMFVNPAFINPRKKSGRKKKGGKKKGRKGRRRQYQVMHGRVALMPIVRRNAGIAPFVQQQNPLILSNPVKRRRRRANPGLSAGSLKSALESGVSTMGGAAIALGANTIALSRIDNPWMRRGAQAAAAIVGGAMLAKKSPTMGAAMAGAMMYPLAQDLLGNAFGQMAAAVGGAVAKEADIDALAADLEDVMDSMDDSDMDDEDAEYF